ncbi:MAG: endonuclease/exonuclease/phosphatase family protein [Patescibacteria group bacterium]
MKNISLFCWNIGNPSIKRAKKQVQWLNKRSEDFFILTETKNSEGCLFIKDYFQKNGYHVLSPNIEGKEYGTMLISKYPLEESTFSNHINSLPFRAVSAQISLPNGTLEIIGLYVPSRDKSAKKIKRKKNFLKNVVQALKFAPVPNFRIILGDFNILEPDHIPHYSFFEEWEYDFYKNLTDNQLKDAFRLVSPNKEEYSWVGRTGDGYRYDHCFVSENILSTIDKCFYLHKPREIRLSDHSAIVTQLSL